MFYYKNISSNLVMHFYYIINIVYVYSWKKIDKILIHLWCNLEKVDFFVSHVAFYLTMPVSLVSSLVKIYQYPRSIQILTCYKIDCMVIPTPPPRTHTL